MEEAAVLAAQHSRAKVPRRCRSITRRSAMFQSRRAAKPGMVIYVQYKTVYVDPTTESKAKQQS